MFNITNNINIQIGIGVVVGVTVTLSVTLSIIFFPKVKLCFNEVIVKPLSWVIRKVRHIYLANQLSAKLEIFASSLKIPGVKKKKLKVQVKFIEQINQDIPENEKVFLFSSSEKKYEENLTKATMQYVDEKIIPKQKQTFNDDMKEGLRLTIAKKIFTEAKELTALEYLLSDILPTELSKYPQLQSIMQELVRTDDYGLFASILLHQYFRLNSTFIETIDIQELKKEVIDFKNYVLAITNRQRRNNTKLRFRGKYFKTLIVLVGSSIKMNQEPDGEYYAHVVRSDQTSDVVYVVAPAIAKDPDEAAVTNLALRRHPKVISKISDDGGFKLIDNQTITLPKFGVTIKVATFMRGSLNKKNEAL